MSLRIEFSKRYAKSLKKLDESKQAEVNAVVNKLANGEILEPKHRDHKLTGNFKDFRECHIRPDLLLIYKKQNEILCLYCFDVGSHSELFKK